MSAESVSAADGASVVAGAIDASWEPWSALLAVDLPSGHLERRSETVWAVLESGGPDGAALAAQLHELCGAGAVEWWSSELGRLLARRYGPVEMSKADAARILGVGPAVVTRLCQRGVFVVLDSGAVQSAEVWDRAEERGWGGSAR